MPSQSQALVLPSLLRAAVPGAINLTADQLDGSFIISIAGQGIPSQQVTLAQLQAYFASGGTAVTVYTSDHTLTAGQSGGVFTNTGAAGSVTLTMPTPAAGLEYTFIASAVQDLILDVGGSVVVALGEVTTTPGGQLSSNSPYSSLTLVALSTTLWAATSLLGTWTPV